MISLSHKYEEFGDTAGFLDGTANLDGREIESEKLQSFEEGYQAGWEDSDQAKGDSEKTAAADVVKNLQDVSFGYHEARSALTQALRPLFTEIFHSFAGRLGTRAKIIGRSNFGPICVTCAARLRGRASLSSTWWPRA